MHHLYLKNSRQINWTNPLTKNMVAHWAFTDNSYLPMNLANVNTKLNYGSNIGSPLYAKSSFNRGLFFSGSNSLSISDYNNLNPVTKMSAEVTFSGANQTGMCIFGHWDSGTVQRSIFIGTGRAGSNDKLQVYVSDDGTVDVNHVKRYESSIICFNRKVHQAVVTFNGNLDEFNIYVDGIKDNNVTKVQDSSISSIYNSTANLTVGCSLNSGVDANVYTGYILRITFWSERALSDKEVFNFYNDPNAIFT